MKVKKDGRIRIRGASEWDTVRVGYALAPYESGSRIAPEDSYTYPNELPVLPVTLSSERSRRSIKGVLFLAGVEVPQSFDISTVDANEIKLAFELVKQGIEQGIKNWPLGSLPRAGS